MTHQMSREEKDGNITLAMAASKAFQVFNSALSEKGAKDEAKMTKLMQERDTTFAALTEAVTNLNLDKVKELCKQFKYRMEHGCLIPVGKGELVWDENQAQAYVNAMRSLQSALEKDGGQHRDDKNRIYTAKNRADNLNLFVTLCRETGAKPLSGMVSGVIRFMLRKLDEQRAQLVKAGDIEKAVEKAKLYKKAELDFSYLLKQDDRPQSQPAAQQPTTGFKAGDVLPEGTAKALQEYVAPPPQGKKPRSGERSSRRR